MAEIGKLFRRSAQIAALSLTVGLSSHSDVPKTELHSEPASSLVLIDMAPERPVAGLRQESYPNNTVFLFKAFAANGALADIFSSPDSIQTPNTTPTPKKVTGTTVKTIRQLLADDNGLGIIRDHGEDVFGIMERVLLNLGVERQPYIYPLQDVIDPTQAQLVIDSQGNEGVQFYIEPEQIIAAIAELPVRPEVINMSFMMDRNGLYRETNRNGQLRMRVESTYGQAPDYQGLRDFFTVARSFPDIVFIAAAGNDGEDLVQARSVLEDEWVENGLLAAQWGSRGPESGVVGADIYVPNEQYGFPYGASFSTAAVSSVYYGLTQRSGNVCTAPGGFIGELFDMTSSVSYTNGDGSLQTARVLRLGGL